MAQWIRGSLARCLAVLVAQLLVLGVMAGMAPASAASSLSHGSAGRPPAGAAALTTVPASLRAAVGQSLGTSVSAAGYSLQAELTPSGRAAGDAFGASVALSARGTTALVGADFHNLTTGAAYVFTLRGGTWSQTAELTASHGAHGDYFGSVVALSAGGTTALVGAPSFNSGAGAAYVFTLRGGTWSQTAKLAAAHGAPFDDFGASVALSARGSTALVGADLRNSGAGAAYVFTLRGGTWSQTAELTAAHEVRDDFFGASVALSAQGSTALIGALGRKTGAAYVFRRRGGAWSQTATLTATHLAPEEQFGSAVALSPLGSTALVGAPEPPGAVTGSGHPGPEAAYMFTLRGGTWSQTAKLTAPRAAADEGFGNSVALSARGGTALVGQPGNLSTSGAAYVFTLRGSTWSQTAELTATHPAPEDQFGSSVALSPQGSTALVGALGQNLGTGAAFVFSGGGRA